MASITLCPRCSSHLELPTGVSPTSQIECPICEAEFLLASVAPRVVPKARVVDAASSFSPAIETEEAETLVVTSREAELAPLETLSHLLRSTSSWQLPGAPSKSPADEAVSSEADDDDDHALSIHRADESEEIEQLDAAYQDADPASAPARNGADELKLEGSRLDQLLSDLMKTPTPAGLPKLAAPEDKNAETYEETHPAGATLPSYDDVETEDRPPIASTTTASTFAAEDDEVADADYEHDHSSESATEPVAARWNEFDESPESLDIELADEEADGDEAFEPALTLNTQPRRKRRPAGVRTLVGIVGGGVLGILGGGYALLWINGPEGDLLGISQWLPAAMLPGSSAPTEPSAFAATNPWSTSVAARGETDAADQTTEPLASTSPLSAPNTVSQLQDEVAPEQSALVDAGEAEDAPPTSEQVVMHHDPAVAPVSAATPVAAPMEETPTEPSVAALPHDVTPSAATAAPATWPTTPIVGSLRGVSLYSLADLEESLTGADAAQRQFLAGDLSRKEDVAAMGKAFIELCGLAERYTLTDPAAFGNELVAKQISAKQVFRAMAGNPARRNDLAMIAGRWLQHDRRQNQGIILLGRVSDLRAQGPWTEYTVDVPLGDSVAAAKVLTDGVRFSTGDEIAVVGVIVANPRQAIADYPGEAPQVVVAGFAFAPEDFALSESSDPADLFTIKP